MNLFFWGAVVILVVLVWGLFTIAKGADDDDRR